MAAIEISHLKKDFQVKKGQKGLGATLKAFVAPDYRTVEAVKDVSFSLKKGERVAFIGPNGAGKSTTIKILSGILHPTSGHVEVLGYIPWRDRQKMSYKIGTVFGQRSQLWQHLPPSDTFNLLARAYDLEESFYQARLKKLTTDFEIKDLMDQPVRQMSLGQRMRCEIVASLLHKPEIIFLDEPTIGLDVSAKAIIRDLIKRASNEDGTTVLLTSHDTGDMEQVCDRVIVIDEGSVLLDQSVEKLKKDFIDEKIVQLITKEETLQLDLPGVTLLDQKPHVMTYTVNRSQTPIEKVIQAVLKKGTLRDLLIEDPPLEGIIQQIYAGKKTAPKRRKKKA